MSKRGDDWYCGCGVLNFSYRDKCFKCSTFKSKSRNNALTSSSSGARAGDWHCPKCNELVFASRSACRKCGSTRNGDSVAAPSQVHAVAESSNARDATASSSSSSVEKVPTMEPGDWFCSICISPTFNFKSRTTCYNCGEAKDKPLPLDSDSTSVCVVCMDKEYCMLLRTCNHHCMCETCCHALDKCPMCKKSYGKDDAIRIFSA